MKKSIKRSFIRITKTYTNLRKEKGTVKSGSDAEWLLDNYYIFSQEYAALRHLRTSSRRMRYIENRMFAWAGKYLAQQDYKLEEWALDDALSHSQQKAAFSSEELGLLPAALSAALLEEAASCCRKIRERGHMGNIVRSFLALRDLDMKTLFEKHSAVDAVLSEDATFAGMTFDSKALYRKAAATLSARCRKSDREVAEKAMALTKGKKKDTGHVGYYLIGDGKNELLSSLSLPPRKPSPRAALYLAGVALLTFLFSCLVYTFTGRFYWVLLTAIPVLDISLQLMQYCMLHSVPARQLPRLGLNTGIPEKILVVYPTLLSSVKKAEEMADKLEICYLANREKLLHFAVLGDFKDSDTPSDNTEIFAACAKKIEALNQKYENQFHLLCRKQEYAPKQKKWMGTERKRGALSALNLFLRGRYTFSYTAGETVKLAGISYVLTLDDDTILPPGAARRLAGVALHPQNAPVVKNGRVVSGYGIIQPRVSLRLESAGRTLFSRIFAGQGGMDTYHTSVSEFYMDVFGESVFTGKGLYHVDTFLSCISFPKDTILSHDLLEGSYVRCALASDVQVFDSFPHRPADHSMRQHRWIRGDWQIASWLFPYVKNESGKKVNNPLSLLSKWKIFDNLRRSITPFFNLLLLVLGSTIPAMLAFSSLMLPVVFSILDSLLQKSFFHLGEKRSANIIYGIRSALYQASLSIAFLAHTAYVGVSAAITGLYRSFTHRRTLEWVTAADAELSRRHSLSASFSYMLPSFLLGLVLLLLCLLGAFPAGGMQLLLAVIWIFAPVLSYISGLVSSPQSVTLPKKETAFLEETATRIWRYFRDYMTEEDHFLPPDNVQIKPYKGVAHRTSPTNIGLGMLAVLCACDLGLIKKEEMEERISQTMDTVEKLPSWKGHLYNWYDTRTLRPLKPRYISTVDSGNFACYLLAVAEGIKEYAGKETPLVLRLLRFAEAMDFRPLYHEKKKLFSIGFSLEENRLTNSYYDLLISEARQAGFLAISLGQIPPEHWFTLGRGLVEADGYRGLVSWSGTMFEYFMPLLLMKSYDNSLLSETYRFALRCQKRAGRRRRVPWGVSESGFYAFDKDDNYQYKAFGVEELGLSRQSAEDVVITPYATLLALMEDPKSALSNMQFLRREGLLGEYGFFEAADYTPSRLGGNMRRGIVKSYMSHHQGMSLAAITNVLCQNSLQRRFHAHPAIRACEPLLKERVPVHAPVIKERLARPTPVRFKWQASAHSVRTLERENTFPKSVQLLTNGSYHVHIDPDGCGCSALDSVRLNTFAPLAGGGQSIWILNPLTGQIIDGYGTKCVFADNRATYLQEGNSISTNLTVSVCAEDNAEVRRLTIVNQSGKDRVLEIYYYTELSLATEGAEKAHPAFSKLFITTKEKDGALYAVRRKRSADEKAFVGFAAAICEAKLEGATGFDTDRLSFFGRGNSLPQMLAEGSIPAGKTGTILDPCFAYKIRIFLEANESASVSFLSGLAENEEKAEEIVHKYKHRPMTSFSPATPTKSIIFKEGEEQSFLHAAAFLLCGGAKIPEITKARERNVLPRKGLWKLGISGDLPLVTLRLTEPADAPYLEEATKALKFWKNAGILVDLAIFCDEPAGYTKPVYEMAEKKKADGIYLFSRGDLEGGDLDLLLSMSALYIDAAEGGFSKLPPFSPLPTERRPEKQKEDGALPPVSLLFSNGFGGFDAEGGDYVIEMTHAGQTPLPWVHVVANENFGFVASEGGGGYTWCENSQSFRLTPWYNDPVHDPPGEQLTLLEKEDVWSPMAAVCPEEGIYRVRYGAGYVTYERNTRDLSHKVTLFTPPEGTQKIVQLTLCNLSEEKRELLAEYAILPVLGTHPHPDRITILEKEKILRFRNAETDAAKETYLFAEGDAKYGRRLHHLYARTPISLQKGASCTITFILGVGALPDKKADVLFSETCAAWQKRLSVLTVETGDKATDLMLNRWLVYQALACRLFARTAFYQSGGAFGFRDQLQDTLALLDIAPELVKKQILLHAAHQFEEGDAFHWWHNDETGVRTRFSDDRLFLPYVACLYAEETGDESIWDEEESFAVEPPLADGEEERYTYVKARTGPYSLYEHAVRAIEISLSKGPHGLPLIGGGDWNDGMNTIGTGGQGESVWLCWFLKAVLDKFAPVAEKRGDTARAERYKKEALMLLEAAETEGWDGSHYARAFFDDGTPVGTSANAECSIDVISQAWSVIAGGARPVRQKAAMDMVWRVLTDHERGILRLLAPPFAKSSPSPGYIQSYPEGLRENGGQYTHGAIWAVIAFAMLGDGEKTMELFRMLNPILRTKTPAEVNIYKTEPYVMTADVYTAKGHEGRGGWSWYTGAAAWMYRLGIRYILGFQKRGDTVSFSPVCPVPFTLRYRYGETQYIFHVHGKSEKIKLLDDGKTHEMTIGTKNV